MNMIENWAAKWWRMWSTRWDAIEYAVLAYFILNPDEVMKLVALLPEGIQPIAALVIPVVLFAAKTGTKMVKQEKLP